MIRRRGLLGASQKAPYILHLDGIENTTNGHSAETRTWYDQSGNGYDFTASAALTWNANALAKNGESTVISCSQAILSGKTSFTVEVCAKLLSQSNYQWLFSNRQYTYGDSYIQFYCNRNTSVFGCDVAINGVTKSSALTGITDSDAVFTSAVVIDGSSASFYSKGVLTNTETIADTSTITAKSLYGIGNTYPWQSVMSCYGNIYSIKIYDCALTAAELLENHQNNITRFGS